MLEKPVQLCGHLMTGQVGPLKLSPMTHYYQALLLCEEPDCQTSLQSWANASTATPVPDRTDGLAR